MKLDSSAFIAEPALVEALRMRAVPLDCVSDRDLFLQGQEPVGLFILHSGKVTMCIEDPGGGTVVSLNIAPGSLLGLPALISNKAYSMSAHAYRGAEISFVDRTEFSKLMLTESALALLILKVLANEVRTARLAIAEK